MIGIICDVVKVTGGYEGSELKDRTEYMLGVIAIKVSE